MVVVQICILLDIHKASDIMLRTSVSFLPICTWCFVPTIYITALYCVNSEQLGQTEDTDRISPGVSFITRSTNINTQKRQDFKIRAVVSLLSKYSYIQSSASISAIHGYSIQSSALISAIHGYSIASTTKILDLSYERVTKLNQYYPLQRHIE